MKRFINSLVFFLVGFVAGGSNAAQARDIHDVVGIIAGIAIVNEVMDDRREHREHHRNEEYDRTYDRRRMRTRPYYEGDIHDAYRKHFPCSRQYAGYRACRRIVEENQTIIIIER